MSRRHSKMRCMAALCLPPPRAIVRSPDGAPLGATDDPAPTIGTSPPPPPSSSSVEEGQAVISNNYFSWPAMPPECSRCDP